MLIPISFFILGLTFHLALRYAVAHREYRDAQQVKAQRRQRRQAKQQQAQQQPKVKQQQPQRPKPIDVNVAYGGTDEAHALWLIDVALAWNHEVEQPVQLALF